MTTTALMSSKGLKSLTVLFMCPPAGLLDAHHAEYARVLGIKYITATFHPTEEGLAIICAQRRYNGQRTIQQFDTLTMATDTLLNSVAASLNQLYSEHVERERFIEEQPMQRGLLNQSTS